MKKVVIAGSSRNDGNTKKIIEQFTEKTNWDIVDLNYFNIGYYDYQNANANDDYLDLMRRMIEQYETFIFATPVYWYSMSGIMKVFFDRLTDLITLEKTLGGQLNGKRMAVISSSNGDHLGKQFWLPFSHTAKYFDMIYLGGVHVVADCGNEKDIINAFIESVESNCALPQ